MDSSSRIPDVLFNRGLSSRVHAIDVHPIRPWVVTAHNSESKVVIWDYKLGQIVHELNLSSLDEERKDPYISTSTIPNTQAQSQISSTNLLGELIYEFKHIELLSSIYFWEFGKQLWISNTISANYFR